jgi:hypothetical protein
MLIGWCIYKENPWAMLMGFFLLFYGLTLAIVSTTLKDLKSLSKLLMHQRNTAMQMFDHMASVKGSQIKEAVEALIKRGDMVVQVVDDDGKVTKH